MAGIGHEQNLLAFRYAKVKRSGGDQGVSARTTIKAWKIGLLKADSPSFIQSLSCLQEQYRDPMTPYHLAALAASLAKNEAVSSPSAGVQACQVQAHHYDRCRHNPERIALAY